jgi:hypothetical protein
MSEDLSQRIGRQKDEWRREFRQARIEITKLQGRLRELKQKLDGADEILASARPAGKSKQTGTKYAKMGVTDAVRAFFLEHRFTPHSISAVMRRLQDEGLPTDAGNPRDIISITCRRLWKKENFLTSELRNGVRVFQLKAKPSNHKKEQAGAGKPTPAVQSF